MCVLLGCHGLRDRVGRRPELPPLEEPEKVQLWMLGRVLSGGCRESPEWEVMRLFQETPSNKSPPAQWRQKREMLEEPFAMTIWLVKID